MPRKPYLTDVSDEEWSFAAPYLTLMDQPAPQREHDLREVFNALRWLVRPMGSRSVDTEAVQGEFTNPALYLEANA